MQKHLKSLYLSLVILSIGGALSCSSAKKQKEISPEQALLEAKTTPVQEQKQEQKIDQKAEIKQELKPEVKLDLKLVEKIKEKNLTNVDVKPLSEIKPAEARLPVIKPIELAKKEEHKADGHKAEEHKADGHKKVEGVDPEKALGWLKNGNTRFITGKLRKDGQRKTDIDRLTKGQKPHAIVLSCSDSRVPPEIVFDQKLGEIFVVRTAGETIDPTSIGSIEYAIEHLGSRLIVILGHTSCGAVTAALASLGGNDLGSPNLNKLVADIHPRIAEYKGKEPSKGLEKEAWSNVRGIAKDLLSRSAIITKAVHSGEVKIVNSLYYMDHGSVKFE